MNDYVLFYKILLLLPLDKLGLRSGPNFFALATNFCEIPIYICLKFVYFAIFLISI